MQFKVFHTVSDLEPLAEEWNELLQNSASHVPFLRFNYLMSWWKTLGGGEWPQGELNVVTARHPDGSLAGVAPLFLTQNRQGEPALMLLGSIEISDFLDIIARPEDIPGFVNGLLDFLCALPIPWQVLDWYNLVDSSPTLPVLKEAALRQNCSIDLEPLQHCPYIPLPSDWETYLSRIDKKQRHEIQRKMRRVEENGLPVRWYIVEDPVSLDAEIDQFLDLMAQDPEKDRFLTTNMRSQMRSIIHTAFREGWLQLAFIEINREKAAGYLNFDYQNHIWVYNSGLNLRYRELSPGWVLLGYLLQYSIEHRRESFDFMRGDEDYKYRFGAVDRRVIRATIRR